MPEFQYEALSPSGQRNQGTLTAASEREVLSVLDGRGLFPLKIQPIAATRPLQIGGGKVRPKHTTVFFAQLADLLRAGVPLLRSLEVLQRQSSQPALQTVLKEVHAQVADGTPLAQALAQHPLAFNELTVSMVRAGQEGGFLEDVLERIAIFTEHQEDLKAKVVGALAYPVFLAAVGLLLLIVLVMFFVPQFQPMFERLDQKGELPGLTKGLIGASQLLIGYWWVMPIVVGGIWVAYRNWSRSDAGRLAVDRFRLNLPIAGQIYLNLAVSRFARILGTLLHNGIPILQSLRIAKDSTGNRVLTEAIDQAAENVTAGDTLAKPLAACSYFPRNVVEMVAVGEESNQLEKVLLDVADGLEKRTGRQLDLFVRFLEPVMLLVMAAVILLVVLGLLLPIFKMSRTVG